MNSWRLSLHHLLLAIMSGVLLITSVGIIQSEPVQAEAINIIPNPSDFSPNGNNFWVEVARNGNGNALEAPVLWLKLYFDQPVGNEIRIINADVCSSGVDTNTNAPTRFRFAQVNDQGEREGSFNPDIYYSQQRSSCPDRVFEVPSGVLTQSALPELEGKYVVLLKAEHQGSSCLPHQSCGGGVNAFKVEALGGGIVGYADLAQNGTQYNTNDPRSTVSNDYGAFAVQQRAGSGPGTFRFEFATKCSDDRIPDNGTNAYLKWFDADYGTGNQANNISWNLRVYDRETNARIPSEDVSASGQELGGNDEYEYKRFTVRRDRKYVWTWNNVTRTNGIQIWIPYDSGNYNFTCDPGATVTGRKVVHQDDGSHVTDTGLNSVFIRHTQGPGSPQTRGTGGASYIIDNLAPGTHRFAFGMNNQLGAHPAAYEFLGYTMCIWGQSGCDGQEQVINYHNNAGHVNQDYVNITIPQSARNRTVSVWWHFERLAPPAEEAEHKIFGATTVEIPQSYVRDNEQFQINVLAYLWPNAGILDRGDNNNVNLWLAGIYGDDRGDNMGIGDQSSNAHPQTWTSFNLAAERGCPTAEAGVCRKRVPAAYVPQSDGLGVATTSTKDGSTTPNGNNWLSIRNESFGSQSSSQVTSCGNYTTSYNRYCGGIASSLNSNIGGFQGNRINNIEMSNIHVEGRGMSGLLDEGGLQGPINRDLLQQPLLFPTSSAQPTLPLQSQGPESGPAWDNIREPSTGLLNITETSPNQTFPNTTRLGGVLNFTYDPQNIGTNYTNSDRVYASGTAVSLLQDGQDSANPPYSNPSEPLTYTASLDSIDRVDLQWDEYVDWSQVDDKGHWYTTRTSGVRTGIARGPASNATASLQTFDQGFSQFSHWHTHHDVQRFGPNADACGTFPNGNPRSCWYHDHADDWDHAHYTTCSGSYTYRTGWQYSYNSMSYTPKQSPQTRYGWRNTQTTTQGMPYGGPGGSSASAFFPSYSSTPSWATTGVTGFWQDTSITNMDNSGSTRRPSHASRWIYNTSDPAYNNRHIYSGSVTPSFPNGWSYTTSTSCRYPNGAGVQSGPSQSVGPYYPSASYLYENSTSASGQVYGLYGSGATFDGASDGVVDTGWAWAANLQRVRYEQTYTGHERKLGPRYRDGAGDERLYGTDPTRATLAGRGMATIFNPIVDVSAADVFSGGNLHSYFQSSQASSAFLFSGNNIINFRYESRRYEDYNLNPNRERVGSHFPADEEPVRYVFRDYNELVNTSAQTCSIPNNLERASSQKSDNVFYCNGDLNISGRTFTGGAGTIIVNGNLYITGDINYSSSLVSDRRLLPSVGFIVRGNIYVDPSVSQISGSYFANGCFNSGSHLLTNASNRSCTQPVGNNNRTTDDSPLSIEGLVIANNFILARQPGGASNRLGNGAEQFFYDGRVVVNPPPGFSRIFTADAVWNDTVPRN